MRTVFLREIILELIEDKIMNQERKIAFCIFAIATAFGLNITGIMPILGMLQERYSDISPSLLRLMQTLPYALTMVGALLIGWLTARLSKKRIALIALFIIGTCGLLPFFFESFYVLFVTRLLIGFGFGIIGPVNAGIIADFMPAEKRAFYLGLNVVGMGIGSLAGNLIGGILAGISLRCFYLVYLMGYIGMVFVILLLPDSAVSPEARKARQQLNTMVWIIAWLAFFHTLFINTYTTNISMYISQEITPDPGASGLATAVSSAASLMMGLVFGKVSGILKRATLPFSIFSAAAGFAAVLFIPGMAGAIISSFLCGVSLSTFNAMGAFLMSIVVRQEAVAKACGLFSVIGGIGGLVAPIILGFLSKGIFGSDAPRSQFSVAFAGMLVVGAVMTWIIIKGIGEPSSV